MKLTLSLLSITLAIVSVSCVSKKEAVINPADYAVYLSRDTDESLLKCNEEMAFWNNKLTQVPESETYRIKLAGLFSSRFMLNGRIEDIQKSDSLYHLVLNNSKQDYSSIHRALAANCITQHKFLEARNEINKALEIGEGKAASLYMLVDVDIELGNYAGAKNIMNDFKNKNFFPYKIRQAKLHDHAGHLDSAILLMENALAEARDNRSLFQWTQSNLADMYGHAGRVKEAYQMYLAILKQDPDYDYALKGIAWIAFSNDHNYAEAKRIVNVIASKRATPDMHLLLAEIADAEKDKAEKEKQIVLFTHAAAVSKYGDMYNKYLALLEAEEFNNAKRTIEIAQIEINNRPTPQSYDLLAWGYLKNGDKEKALEVANKYVEDKTFEPEALYHFAMILEANGKQEEAHRYFKEVNESSFELGPAIASEIESRLN